MKHVVRKLMMSFVSSILVLLSGFTAYAHSDIETNVTSVGQDQVVVTVRNISDSTLANVDVQIGLSEGLQLLDSSSPRESLGVGESYSFKAKVAQKDVSRQQTPLAGLLPRTGEKWFSFVIIGIGLTLLALSIWKYKVGKIALVFLLLALSFGRTALAQTGYRIVSEHYKLHLFDKEYPIDVTIHYEYVSSDNNHSTNLPVNIGVENSDVVPSVEESRIPSPEISPPVAEVLPPSSEATPPVAEVLPPSSEATPPVAEVLPPSSEATPPAAEVLPPSSEVNPPAAEVLPPSSEATPPVAEVLPPSSEATPPAAEVLPPSSEATPPVAEVLPPSSEATPPVAEVLPPSSEATPPAAEVLPPSSEVNPPAAEVLPPSSEATPPVAEVLPPSSEATPPAAEVLPPSSEATPPVAEVLPPSSEATPPVAEVLPPSSEATPPVAEVLPPSSEVNPPVAEVLPPSSEATPPVAEVLPPSSEATPPAAEVLPPSSEVNPPVAEVLPPSSEATPPVAEVLPPSSEATPPVAEVLPPSSEETPPAKEIALSGYAYGPNQVLLSESNLTLSANELPIRQISTDIDGYTYMHLIQGKDYRLVADGLDVSLRAIEENNIHIENHVGQFSSGKINRTENGFTSLKPSVIQLDDVVDYRISEDRSSVTLPDATGIKAGDVLVLPSSPTYASYSSFKVLAVQEIDGGLVVQVGPVQLEDVLERAEFKGELPVTDAQFIPAEGVEVIDEVVDIDTFERASAQLSHSKSFKLSRDGVTYQLTFKGSIGADIDLSPWSSKLILTPSIDVTAKADFKQSRSYSREFLIGSVVFPGASGIGLNADVYIVVNASGEVQVILTSKYVYNAKLGYWDGEVRFEPNSSLTNVLDLKLKGYAKIGPKLVLRPTLFGVGPAEFNVAMGLGLDGQFEARLSSQNLGTPKLERAKGNLVFFADLSAGYKLDLLAIKKEGKWLDNQRFYEKKFINLTYEAPKPNNPKQPQVDNGQNGTNTDSTLIDSSRDSLTLITTHSYTRERYEDFGTPNAASDFEYKEINQGIKITNYIGQRKDVVIPREIAGVEVVSLGFGSFQSKELTSVAIPDTVTELENYVFDDNKLRRVYIPDSIKTISYNAFSHNHLESVFIPYSVNVIEWGAFSNNRLKTVYLPESLKSIGNSAFSSNRLEQIHLPASLKSIGDSAFAFNRLVELNLPDSIKTIKSSAFSNNRLKKLVLPKSLTSLGYYGYVFANNLLEEVVIPGSLESIPQHAFTNNHLTKLTIEEGVKYISRNAFDSNSLTSVTIPSTVESISNQAFYNNNISRVSLPSHLTGGKLASDAFDHTVQLDYP